MKQLTIANKISGNGIGLHKGSLVYYELAPLESNSGIVFYRKDLDRYYEAKASSVVNTQMATVIGDERGYINTIEHLMSALAAFGIDNILITLDANEAPVFDGSSLAWCSLLQTAGIAECQEAKELLVIKRKVQVSDGAKKAILKPIKKQVEYEFSINFAHLAIGEQHYKFLFNQRNYLEQIAPARTFGFLKDVQALKARGLALGGSLDNAVVLDENGVMNPEGLRFSNEFVRHKILDAIGDIYMLGHGVLGSYKGIAGSHALNHELTKAVLASSQNYEILKAKEALELAQVLSFC